MAAIIYHKHFQKQFLNIARLFMNLIKSDSFNTFHYKFLILIYYIDHKKVYERRLYEKREDKRRNSKRRRRRTTTSPGQS